MDEQLKEALVGRFRTYLETDFDLEDDEKKDDLYSLFSEISGLKNEVRIESRQLKSALDDFREAFSTLDGANNNLSEMFLNFQLQQKEQEKQTLKPVIFGLIDLYDRLAAGLEQKPPEQNMFFSLFHDRHHERWFEAHQEGQKMILGRVLDLLNLCEVSVFEVTGMIFNPAKMKAVQFKTDSDRKNGLVLYECRKGFLWGSRVIRSAEVIVNKIQE